VIFQKTGCSFFILTRLNLNINFITYLNNGTQKLIQYTFYFHKYSIQVPRVAELATIFLDLLTVTVAKFQTPISARFRVNHDTFGG
jgi:hypothetical protein